MNLDVARTLFETGRSHALSCVLLYRASISEGERNRVSDTELFAFNGPHSLSVHYLLGLGLELMLKAAMIMSGGPFDRKSLLDIGHDLTKALDEAEKVGFRSNAPRLAHIVQVMREPYKAHWLRYDRPEEFQLPGDFEQIIEALEVLDEELRARLWGDEPR